MKSGNSVEVKDLWKTYGEKPALRGVSLSLQGPGIFGLLGPNGAGKTTLAKILLGILTPDSGKVLVNGFVPWEREEEFFKSVGFVFGNRSSLIYDLPVRDSFEFFGELYGVKDWEERMKNLAERGKFADLLEVPVRKLSLGQRMKAEIGLALLHDPLFLLLDEATLGLDPLARSQLYEFLREIAKEKTVLFTSHNLWEVELLCQDVFFLHKGKLFFRKSVEELKASGKLRVVAQVRDPQAAGLKGHLFEGEVAREELETVMRKLLKGGLLSLQVSEPPLEEILLGFYGEDS